MSMFYVWVLANVMVGCHESLEALNAQSLDRATDIDALLEFNETELRDLIGAYEKNQPLSAELNEVASRLTIDRVKQLLLRSADALGRRRIVLLLDDAALKAVQNWRFLPAKQGAMALASWVEFPIRFRPQHDEGGGGAAQGSKIKALAGKFHSLFGNLSRETCLTSYHFSSYYKPKAWATPAP